MNNRRWLSIPWFVCLSFVTTCYGGDLVVATDFPGGAAEEVQIDQEARRIVFKPGGKKERGWQCWWHFRVTGVTAGETLTLELIGSGFATPARAMVSDDGRAWKHSAPGVREKDRLVYRVSAAGPALHCAWGPPFAAADAERIVDEATRRCPVAKKWRLGDSREQRPVWGVRIEESPAADKPPPVVWVQARQHAWESGASWVAHGFLEWATSDDPRARSLCKSYTVIVIPIMDMDNVEAGNGGKNQQPHDHNRDWSDEPVHPEVAAAIRHLRELDAAQGVAVFIDLHNPGPGDGEPFFFVPDGSLLSDREKQNLDRFLTAAWLEMTGPLKLSKTTRETGPKYDQNWEKISMNWVSNSLRNDVLSLCLETSWNTPRSLPDNYRQIGRELGQAIERYGRQEK